MDRKPFGRLPALHGADFPAEMGGNLFPRNQFLFRKGRPFGTWRNSVFQHYLGCSIEAMECADYTLRECRIRKGSFLVSGFGGNGAGGGADEEPFGGTADAAPGAAASRDAQSVVAFVGECGAFLSFIGEVALGGGELRLAPFATSGEVLKTCQGFDRD